MSATISITTILSLLGLAIAYFYMKKVTAIPLDLGLEEKDGTRLKFIHGAIANGAMAFLKQEYKFLTIFMVVFAAIIAILIDDSHTTDIREGIYTALAFLFGHEHPQIFRFALLVAPSGLALVSAGWCAGETADTRLTLKAEGSVLLHHCRAKVMQRDL